MTKILFLGLISILCSSGVFSQETKPWSEWSKGNAEKILNKSAWGQSLVKGEAPVEQRSRNPGSQNPQLGDPGTARVPSEIYLRVRFITAKPIREGFANKFLRSQPNATADVKDQLQKIVDNGFGDFIVVGVNVEGQNPQTVAPTLQSLLRLNTEAIGEKVYLERKDGKRLPLLEYKPPVADDMGGKFVFARSLDGMPFITPDAETVRFVVNLSGNLKFNMRFDVSKMLYAGKLEY